MAEEKNVKTEEAKEDTKKKEPIDCDVTEDENGNMKAKPKKTVKETAVDIGKKAWGFFKIAAPAFVAGGLTAVGVANFIAGKEEKEQERLSENNDSVQPSQEAYKPDEANDN